MQYYHFERLIKKYSTTFTVLTPTGGDFDDYGDFVDESQKRKQLQGAILSNRENKVFKSNGTLTERDKVLYMLEPLKKDLQGAEIVYNEDLYRIENKLENAFFTGVYAYSLKYISVFNGDEE